MCIPFRPFKIRWEYGHTNNTLKLDSSDSSEMNFPLKSFITIIYIQVLGYLACHNS
jgi:hypothetical protein